MKGGMNMHNNFDPEKIEELLRNAPKIEDTRSKEEVFARLEAEGVFDEVVEQPKQKTVRPFKRKIPFFKVASFVALFALVITTSIMVSKDDMLNVANDQADIELSGKEERLMGKENKDKEFNISQGEDVQEESMVDMVRTGDYRTGLYADELGDEIIFTIGMSGNAAESVPISMKIPLSFLNDNGLSSDSSYLQIYELVAPLLDEQALGFSEYHPYVGRFEENGDQLIHYLPDDHSYDLAPAAMSNYFGSLNDTFGSHYKEVLLQNNDGDPVVFFEIGEMSESIVLKGMENSMNYFVFEQDNGARYLSTNFRTSYTTLTDAFAALKDEWNDIYKTAMINDINFELEDRGTYTAVKFVQPLDVVEYEMDQLMYMLEAIVATAASFGEQVKFENVMQEEWGGFQFTEVIPQLMGVNEIDFPLQ